MGFKENMKYFKKKRIIITALVFLIACLISGYLVYLNFKKDNLSVAAAPICGDNNVAGFAWSDNIGWISFNKGDCINGVICRNITTKEVNNYSCTTNECVNNGGECADWCQVCDNNSKIICDSSSDCGGGVCVDNSYGVKIDFTTGNFSGYGWSSNIGWVSFQENNPPDNYSFNANCPSTCDSSNNCTACYNSTSGNVYGWAKALALGDDGWLKLSDASWSNGVKINGMTKEFEGWAWNGNATAGTGIGWLSFNCLDTGTCAVSDYKVYITNTAPTARELKAPNITYQQACSSRDARRVQLIWEFNDPDEAACGDYQSAYQVIVDETAHISSELDSMAVNTTTSLPLKTPKLSGSANSIYPTNPGNYPDYTGVDLSYDKQYYWWVKVWDKFGADSGWVQYNSDLLIPPNDTDNDDGNNLTFWTYKHEFPEPYFYWFPLEPSEGENVSFWDGSYYYTLVEPNANHQLCFENGVQDCSAFNWTGSNPATQILSPTASSTSIIFDPAKTSQYIMLQTTDPDGYYCSTSTTFWAKVKLPTWKEVKYK